jgi:hypothetical protein
MHKLKTLALIGLAVVTVITISLPLLCKSLVRRAVEEIGPRLTGTRVQLQDVDLSLISGQLVLKDLSIGNPPGYQAPTAVRVRAIRATIDWSSLLRRPLFIREIVIEGPDVTLEGSQTRNNLTALRDHVRTATNGASSGRISKRERPSQQEQSAAWVIVKTLRIVETRLNVSLRTGSLETNVRGISVREITVRDLGDANHATSIGEITAQILGTLTTEVTGAVTKSGAGIIEEAGRTAGRSVSEAVDGVKDLLK